MSDLDNQLAYRFADQSGKFTTLANLLDQFNKQSNKLLLFSQTKKVLNVIECMLREKAIPWVRLDGDIEVRQRMDIIKAFTGLKNE